MDGGKRRGPIVSYQWMGEEDVDLSLAINGKMNKQVDRFMYFA